MGEQRLAEILARVGAAAPGPWVSDGAEFYGTLGGVLMIDLWVGETLDIDDLPQSEANAAFVAAARSDVPELVAEVQRLLAERHSTNEALSDAAETIRVQRDRIAELEALTPAPIQTCQTCGAGYNLGQPCQVCAYRALVAAELKRQAEDPHAGPLHHAYELGRDLPEVTPQQEWRGGTELVPDREIYALAATGLVGYRQNQGRLLHCLAHKPVPASRYADFHEVMADDLPDGGICVYRHCGRDLLAQWPTPEVTP